MQPLYILLTLFLSSPLLCMDRIIAHDAVEQKKDEKAREKKLKKNRRAFRKQQEAFAKQADSASGHFSHVYSDPHDDNTTS